MFKRVKSKPTQRTRPSSPELDQTDDATTTTADESPSTLATKLKKKSKNRSRLSFGGDEDEGDSFKVKKSNLSYQVSQALPISNLDQASISPKYDQAHLRELKASTPSSRPSLSYDADTSYDADMSMEIADVSVGTIDIPSESSIQVAKEKRKRLQPGPEKDYISLSLSVQSKDDGPHPESRLVREEDELGEGDDEYAEYTSAQERIALGKKSMKKEAEKRRDIMKEMIEDAQEDDEESAEWVNEQLRRGGHRTPEPSARVKRTYKPTPIPATTPVPTLGAALSRLTQQLAQLTTSHATNTAALNSLAMERTEVDDREREMRGMVDKAEEKRAWFNSFREWLESVAGFLDEKYPLLEKLEEEHLSLLQERRDVISSRRRADDEDDLSTFYGPLPRTESVQTDEQGDSSAQKSERRAARIARRQLRQKKQDAEEGFSTDSDLGDADEAAYRNALAKLDTRKKQVLSDVKAEEFRDPGKGQWNVWRERYSDSYIGAWGGLGVVSVWEFWARLECLGWDCIEDRRELSDFKWYDGLHTYSHPDPDDAQALGPDGDLVSSMMTTAIIPRLSKSLDAGALDVHSAKHIQRAMDIVDEVAISVDSDITVARNNPKVQMLFKSVINAFDKSITDAENLIAKYVAASRPSPFDPAVIPARKRFLARQMKLLHNLLRWRRHTDGLFGVELLIARLLNACILRVADGGWDVGGEDVVKRVVAMLPQELITPGIKNRLGIR